MIISRQERSSVAARIALGLVVASTLVIGVPAVAAPTQTYTNHKPLSGPFPGSYQAYPNPKYPNHKPLRGNYPGSYTKSPSTPVDQPSGQFDWLAAGIGAAGMLGLILLLTAVKKSAQIARDNRRHEVPLVVQVDDPPGVG
jgi:hypothetical protein